MGKYQIAVMAGDGIGPEIVTETVKVLEAVQSVVGKLELDFRKLPIGLEAYNELGSTLPEVTIDGLKQSQAAILGPLTTHIYEKDNPYTVNPSGTLRKRFDLYANIRPARNFPGVNTKFEGVDLVVVRENTEGMYADRNLYYGNGEFMPDEDTVLSLRVVTRNASQRLAKVGMELASSRGKYVSVVHKMNVLHKGCGIFVNSCKEIAKDYPEISIDDYHVDAFALHLVQRPHEFDVIVTTNMFGDIISDLTAGLIGGLGLAPGMNLGDQFMIAQATHGSAPDIANKGIANPTAEILSAKMMLEWLGIRYQDEDATRAAIIIEESIDAVLEQGIKPPDLGGTASTKQYGDAIVDYIKTLRG